MLGNDLSITFEVSWDKQLDTIGSIESTGWVNSHYASL